MNTSIEHRRCLIVGAGIAGLMAARALTNSGISVKVLEKADRVGGRMATMSFGGGIFDYGAQFLTARDRRFRSFVDRWQEDSAVKIWSYGFDSTSTGNRPSGHPRFRGHPNMAAIPQALTEGIDIDLNGPIRSASVQDGCWQIVLDDQRTYGGDALILTPPVPQALQIAQSDSYTLPPDVERDLHGIRYHLCIALMLVLDEPSAIPEPGAINMESERIRWIADNRQKGISIQQTAITIHATPEFSREYWDASDSVIRETLHADSAEYLSGAALDARVYRWRYSQPVDLNRNSNVVVAGPPPLIFAGDAFAGGRVEGAALSGLDAADWLVKLWKSN